MSHKDVAVTDAGTISDTLKKLNNYLVFTGSHLVSVNTTYISLQTMGSFIWCEVNAPCMSPSF